MYHRIFPLFLLSFFLLVLVFPPAYADPSVPIESCPTTSRDQQQQDHQSLLEQISYHNHLYDQGTPELSDADYDALVQRQRLLEQCLGITTASTVTVPPLDQRHRFPLGSLKKAETPAQIEQFLQHAHRLGSPVVVQPKIDGLAIELVYRNSKLVQALTRGMHRNGQGIDLMPLIAKITAIPLTLPSNLSEIVLHGELYALNTNPFAKNAASPRHYVAGLINRNTPATDELRQLRFFPWQWVKSPLADLRANGRQLATWGFADVQQQTHVVKTIEDIARLRYNYQHTELAEQRPLDGIVIKLSKTAIQNRLGYLDGTPYWALAWKFPATSAATVVTGVEWRIGRTGQISGILTFEPVAINGLTLSRIHIGPAQYFSSLDIAANDTVIVALKGGTTPVFQRVLDRPNQRLELPAPDSEHYNAFTCFQPTAECRQQFLARLNWLIGPHGLNLPDLNMPDLNHLIDTGKLQQLDDLFKLTTDDISLEAKEAIANSLNDLDRAFVQSIRALGIPGIGRKRTQKLASHTQQWQELKRANSAQWQEWLDCSAREAKAIQTYLQLPEVQALAKYLFSDSNL